MFRPKTKRAEHMLAAAAQEAASSAMLGQRVLIDVGDEFRAARMERELANMGVLGVKRGGQFIEVDGNKLH